MRLRSQRLISLVNIALGAGLIISGLVLVRDAVTLAYRETKGASLEADKQREARLGQKKRAFLAYAPILGNNVFGFSAGQLRPLSAGPEATSQVVSPVERVDIALMGTVSWPGRFGYAVVMDDSGRQNVYKTGDYILGAGLLKKVEKDRIFIESGGKEVEVALVETASVKEITRPTGRRGARKGDFAKKTAEGSYVIDRKAIQSALEKPRQIMTDARLLPHVVDGKQKGFVIREIKPGGVYQSLGLKNGDILLRVNEFSISDPETALQAFTALRGMDRIELDVVRGGSTMNLTYMIR